MASGSTRWCSLLSTSFSTRRRIALQELQHFVTATGSFAVGACPDAPAPKLHSAFHLGRAMHELPKPLQVYVVEDSPIIRRLLASTIEAAGAKLVGYSADASSAIAD